MKNKIRQSKKIRLLKMIINKRNKLNVKINKKLEKPDITEKKN
jgi:hypothetical protein